MPNIGSVQPSAGTQPQSLNFMSAPVELSASSLTVNSGRGGSGSSVSSADQGNYRTVFLDALAKKSEEEVAAAKKSPPVSNQTDSTASLPADTMQTSQPLQMP